MAIPPEDAIQVALDDGLRRSDVPGICARLLELVRDRRPGLVVCDLRAIERADVVTVDTLARLRLSSNRLGWRIRFTNMSADLARLVHLLGLHEVLASRFEPQRQADQWDEPFDAEDAGQGDDLAT